MQSFSSNRVEMSPSEKYAELVKIARFFCKLCGADIFNPYYRISKTTGLIVLVIASYFVLTIYTIQLKITANPGIILEAFCMIGAAIQGIAKLSFAIIYKTQIFELNSFLESIYTHYEKKSKKYSKSLDESVSLVALFFKSIALIYFLIYLWLISIPPLLYVLTGQRYMSMQFYFPGLDVATDFGYFSTIAVHTFILFISAFGSFAGDTFMIIFNTHNLLFVNIFELKISELNLAAKDNVETVYTIKQLRDIADWHQKYCKFGDINNKMFFWMVFVKTTTSALSIVLTLYIIMTGNWPGSYAYLVLEFSTFYTYCGIGTLVEITNDKFCKSIYAINWYELSVSQQKSVLLMLMKSQVQNPITVGGVTPLSVNTGLQVTKTIYSIFMMMINFIK